MDDQVPRIQSDKCSTLMKCCSVNLKILIVSLCLLSASIPSVQTSTCPNSIPNSAEITTDQYSFNGYSQVRMYKVVAGPVTNSLYYISRISSSS